MRNDMDVFNWLHDELPAVAWLLLHLKGGFELATRRGETYSVTIYDQADKHGPYIYDFSKKIQYVRAAVPKSWKKPSVEQFREDLGHIVDYLFPWYLDPDEEEPSVTDMVTGSESEFVYQLKRLADHYLGGH